MKEEDLVSSLRAMINDKRSLVWYHESIILDAAEAIERLQAEIDEMKIREHPATDNPVHLLPFVDCVLRIASAPNSRPMAPGRPRLTPVQRAESRQRDLERARAFMRRKRLAAKTAGNADGNR